MNFTKTTFVTFCLVFLVAFCGFYKFQLNDDAITQNVPIEETPSTAEKILNTHSVPTMSEIDINLDAPLQAEVPEEPKEVIAIDPGHGGYDPGKVGSCNNYEKDINLKIALKLRDFLEEHKYKIVLTRSEDKDLDSFDDKFHKREDMQARIKTINESGAAIVVSIHQNAFAQEKAKGAQVFYFNDESLGKNLAASVKNSIKEMADPDNIREIKHSEEYYILKKSNVPGIIVECGFLTNPEEEAKLLSNEYQTKMAQAIGTGIINFLESVSAEQAIN